MTYNRQITITTAGSRKATKWQPSTIWWSELVERLHTPVRSVESLNQYLKMPKSQQDDLKDVGGYVAGTLQGTRRKANAVVGRDVLTLDMDSIPSGGTKNVLQRLESLQCAYCVYSTRKHEEAKPRLRVLLPLFETCSADEYEPIARKIAESIGIELCDPSTFEASRLMYWPSCSADSIYVYHYADKPFLNPKGVLDLYTNWSDITQWPQVPGALETLKRPGVKQEDPTQKPGVVGAFCRVYDIYKVIHELLPGVYVPTDTPDRYTYAGGSTTGGAVVYDNGLFLYSHHATDPCGGREVNAFDLVRLHKFGDQDDNAVYGTPTNRLPSYSAMKQLAIADPDVKALMQTERYKEATEVFSTSEDKASANELDWLNDLKINFNTGKYEKTVDNVMIILENDPLLKDKLAYDEFANRGLALGSLPWDDRTQRRQWTDTDDAGLRHYIEKVYEISGKERLLDATQLCAFKCRINDVKDYLCTLSWDGIKRLDTLLSDYLGAEDSVYTRAVIRKSLAAAVARAMVPGTKYDYMPIFAGSQGIGKSTFLRLLGLRWYSDSLTTFEGKEAREMVQGTWINELGELNGMTRSEITAVKQFLSQQEDIYREPYGRRTNQYPRRCVFFGTTNDTEFLRDRTGNRRFWPVDVGLYQPRKDVFSLLATEVDQIWAEAFVAWQAGEALYLKGEAEQISVEQQEAHRESNAKEGLIREFIERPIPKNWEKRSIGERRMYWCSDFKTNAIETEKRQKVCAAEIWCECFGSDIKYMKRGDSVEINSILSGIRGWKRHHSTQRFGVYGIQRGFEKIV